MILEILVAMLVVTVVFAVGWWLIITTEGVYLGRGVVIWLYDVYASRYERIKGYDAPVESRYLAQPIMRQLLPNNAPMVLDVATGTGRLPRTLMLHHAFHGRVVGVDLSRRMLHHGVGKVAEAMYHNRVYLMHAPAESLPFDDGTFDLVSCLEALEFMSQPRAVVAELIRVTRPGGWLLLTNRKGVEAKMMPLKAWTPEQAEAIYTQEFGLEDVEIIRWQLDYDLVWARKAGDSLPTRSRPLEEIWQCPNCQQKQLALVDRLQYQCENCGQLVPVGRDGVIELMKVKLVSISSHNTHSVNH